MESESRALFDTLQKLGVTTEVVLWCRKNAKVISAFDGLKFQIFEVDIEPYTIGSFADGSYRDRFQSDIDNLNIYNHDPVFENADLAHNGRFHLILTNEATKPGYVELEVRESKTDKVKVALHQPKSNSKQRFLSHKSDTFAQRQTPNGRILKTNKRLIDSKYKLESHGPAEANVSPSLSNEEENVFAYRCGDWPQVAERWVQRCHTYRWPSSEDLKTLKQTPLHMVPMGHPHSEEKEKETQWRYSFTLHEQFLTSKLNETQLKCYFLLKQIKEDLIKPGTKALTKHTKGKSLTSYHCKTSLLYTIQRENPDMWRPEKLIVCVLHCLRLLLQWLDEEFIPDFFIPEQNLMDGKIEGPALISKIVELLEMVMSDPVTSLKRLNNTGRMFSCALASNQIELSTLYDSAENELALMILLYMTKTAVAGFDLCGYCLHYIANNSKNIKEAVNNHHHVMNSFHRFMEKQGEDVQNALQQGLCFLHTSLASHLAIMATRSDPWVRDWISVASAMNFAAGSSHNVASSKLKLANVLLMSRHVESAKHVLDDFDKNVDKSTLCINFGMAAPVSDLEKDFCISCLRGIGLDNVIKLPCSLLLQKFLSAPVLFLPTEMELTPDALKFEMFRSIATPPDSMVLHLQYWYRWASVDITVMAPFLKYLANHGKDLAALCDDLTRVVSMNNSETPQNILGWAAMSEGYTTLAAQCFLESWNICSRRTAKLTDVFQIERELLRQHNAAKLWMLVLMLKCNDPGNRHMGKKGKDENTGIFDQLEILYSRVKSPA